MLQRRHSFLRGASNTLSMTATYAGAGQLSVVPGEGMSDVVMVT